MKTYTGIIWLGNEQGEHRFSVRPRSCEDAVVRLELSPGAAMRRVLDELPTR